MEVQLLKNLLATAIEDNYDWDTIMPKFPQLKDVDTQLLKDYAATAIEDNYDYSVINPKFPEFFGDSLKKKVVTTTTAYPLGQENTSTTLVTGNPNQEQGTPSVSLGSTEYKPSTIKDIGERPNETTINPITEKPYNINNMMEAASLKKIQQDWDKENAKNTLGTELSVEQQYGVKKIKEERQKDKELASKENLQSRIRKSRKIQSDIEKDALSKTRPTKESINPATGKVYGEELIGEKELLRDQLLFDQQQDIAKIQSTKYDYLTPELFTQYEGSVAEFLNAREDLNKNFIFEETGFNLLGNSDFIRVSTVDKDGNKNGMREYTFEVDIDEGAEKNIEKLKIFLDRNRRASLEDRSRAQQEIVAITGQVVPSQRARLKENMLKIDPLLGPTVTDATQVVLTPVTVPEWQLSLGKQDELLNETGVILYETATEEDELKAIANIDKIKEKFKLTTRDNYSVEQFQEDLKNAENTLMATSGSTAAALTNEINSSISTALNDNALQLKDVQKRNEQLSKDQESILLKVKNGEQVSESDIAKLEFDAAVLERDTEDLTMSDSELNVLMKDIKDNAAAIALINEGEGSKSGTITNNLIRGGGTFLRMLGADRTLVDKIVREASDPSTKGEYEKSRERTFTDKILATLSNMAGIVIPSAITGPMSAYVSAAGFMAQAKYQLRDEMDDNPDFNYMSDSKKEFISNIYGGVVGLLERYGLSKMISKSPLSKRATLVILRDVLQNLPKTVTTKTMTKAIQATTKRLVSNGGIQVLAAGGAEASTEVAQGGFEIGLKEVVNSMEGADLFKQDLSGQAIFENLFEAGALGIVAGGVTQGASQAASITKQGFKNSGLSEMISNSVLSLNRSKEFRSTMSNYFKTKILQGEITREEALKSLQAYDVMMGRASKIPSNIDNITGAFDLITERANIESEIEGKDPALIVKQKERIKEINSELGALTEKAPVAEEAPVVVEEDPQQLLESVDDQGRSAKPGARLFNDPNPETSDITNRYKKEKGIETPAGEKITKLDTNKSMEIADAYEAMENNPNDPEVKEAYESLANETIDQYKAMIDAGYQIEIYEGKAEPYSNSKEMIDDLINNKHMYIFSTEQGYGEAGITDQQRQENAMLADTEFVDKNGKPLLINDLFRGVHDFFGHSERGNGFGAKGEENAWDVHARMFTDKARRAMTAETRGQNSWVNFGPQMRDSKGNLLKKGDIGYKSAKERDFAPQKIGLLPKQYSEIIETSTTAPKVEAEPTVKAKNTEKQKTKIRKQVDRAKRSVRSVLKNVEFIVHESDADFVKATGSSDSGAFERIGGKFKIHVNMDKANNRTVGHEVFHALLLSGGITDSQARKMTGSMLASVRKVASPEMLAKLDKFAAAYPEKLYNEESIAELFGIISENYSELNDSGKSAIKEWLAKLVKALKLDKIINVNSSILEASNDEVIEFLDAVAKKVATGQEIVEGDVSILSEAKDDTAGVDTETRKRRQAEDLFLSDNKKKFNSLKDIASFIDSWTKENKLFDNDIKNIPDKEVVNEFAKHIELELKAWEKVRKDEYVSFYDNDIIEKTNPILQEYAKKEYGRPLTDTEVKLYHIVSAFASPNANPEMDSWKGFDIFDRFMKTGELSGYSDKIATVWDWTTTAKGKKVKKDTGVPRLDKDGNTSRSKMTMAYSQSGLDKFNILIDKVGGDMNKAIDWITSTHSHKEISDMFGYADKGSKKLEQNEYLSKEDGGLGVFGMTGAKLGSYILNRFGNFSTVTKDMWYARTMARLAGEDLTTSKGDAIKVPWAESTVQGRRTRTLADKAFKAVADKLGTQPAMIQERIWDFEKRLYEMYGATKDAAYTSDGLKKGIEMASKATISRQQKTGSAYFSNALKAAENIKDTNPKQPVQWVKALTDPQKNGGVGGVNQELKWIGLEDYLTEWQKENKVKSVPQNIVEDYINDNQIEIVDVTMSETKYGSYTLDGGENYQEVLLTLPDEIPNLAEYNTTVVEYNNFFRDLGISKPTALQRKTEKQLKDKLKSLKETLPLNKLKENSRTNFLSKKEPFESSHFDEENILAHVRINERTLPNGEKVMFIEEVQSDWAQEGKKKGFRDSSLLSEQKRVKQNLEKESKVRRETEGKLNKLNPEIGAREKFIKEFEDKSNDNLNKKRIDLENKLDQARNNRDYDNIKKELDTVNNELKEKYPDGDFDQEEIDTFKTELVDLLQEKKSLDETISILDSGREIDIKTEEELDRKVMSSAPDMPYKKTDQWVGLAIRRVMKMAADKGFDRIAWVTGEQSADRYSLEKQVDEIQYRKLQDDKYAIVINKDGQQQTKRELKESELESFVGKEIAQKIINNEGKETTIGRDTKIKSLSGLELKVGGEGMKTFYNSIVPKVALAEAKRFDKKAKVDVISLPNSVFKEEVNPPTTKQLSIAITPEMNQKLEGGIGVTRQQKINWEVSEEGKGDPSISSRDDVVSRAAKKLKEGKISNKKWREIVNKRSPITPITRFFAPATLYRMKSALNVRQMPLINAVIEAGAKVGIRLDINAYKNKNTWVVSIHNNENNLGVAGKVISYRNVAKIKNVRFDSSEISTPRSALNIATGDKNKATIARIYGEWVNFDGKNSEGQAENAKKEAQDIVNSKEWVQIGMNPFRHSYFYDRSTVDKDGKIIGDPVKTADELLQIGGLVYAKNPTYGKWTDKEYIVQVKNQVTKEMQPLLDSEGDAIRFQKDGDKFVNQPTIEEIIRANPDSSVLDVNKELVRVGYSKEQIQKYREKEEGVYNPKTGSIKVDAIIKSVNSFRKRMLSARSLLPKSWYKFLEQKEANIAYHLRYSEKLAKLYNKEIGKYKGDKKELAEDFDAYLRGKRWRRKESNVLPKIYKSTTDRTEYFKNKVKGSEEIILPEKIQGVAVSMRNHVDALSQSLIDAGIVDGLSAENVQNNIGEYLTTSYKMYRADNWRDQVSDQVKQAAKNYIEQNNRSIIKDIAKEEGLSYTEAAKEYVDAEIEKILQKGEEGSFATKRGVSKDLSILKRKKDIDPAIENLMGIYNEPGLSYLETIMKVSALQAQHNYMSNIRKSGEGVFLFSRAKGKFTYKIASDTNDAMAPLNGLYTTKELKDELEASTKELSGFLKNYMKVVGVIKYGKTILSPATHAKNILGNLGFMFVNGHFNPVDWASAFNTLVRDSISLTESEYSRKMDEYIKVGVAGQSAGLGELKAMLSDATSKGSFEEAMIDRLSRKSLSVKQRIGKGIGKAGKFFENAYQAEDDLFKIIAYESEKARHLKVVAYEENKKVSELTDKEIERAKEMAAEKVKNTLPTYSRVPYIIQMARKSPLVGSFVAFHAESFRTAANTAVISIQELTSSNPELRMIGAKRIAGTGAYLAAKAGILSAYSWGAGAGIGLMGGLFDDDDEIQIQKDIARFLPSYSKDSDILITSIKPGEVKYIDTSASDPHGSIAKMLNAFLRSDTTIEGIINSARAFLDPILGLEIATEAVQNLFNNQDVYGRRIYDETDTAPDIIYDVSLFIAKVIEPGGLTSARRIIRADDPRSEIIGATTGYREREIELKNDGRWLIIEKVEAISESMKSYNSIFNKYERNILSKYEGQKVSEKDIVTKEMVIKEYKEANGKVRALQKELIEIWNSLDRLGMTPINKLQLQQYNLFKNSGISQENIQNIGYNKIYDIKPKEGEGGIGDDIDYGDIILGEPIKKKY